MRRIVSSLKLLTHCGALYEGGWCANCSETCQDHLPTHDGFMWPLHLSHWVKILLTFTLPRFQHPFYFYYELYNFLTLKINLNKMLGGSRFEEKGRKQAVTIGAVAVFVPYLDHVENRIMAYGTAALLR